MNDAYITAVPCCYEYFHIIGNFYLDISDWR